MTGTTVLVLSGLMLTVANGCLGGAEFGVLDHSIRMIKGFFVPWITLLRGANRPARCGTTMESVMSGIRGEVK